MARLRTTTVFRGLAVLTAVGGLTAVPVAVHAQEDPAPSRVTAAPAQDRVFTLLTGQRVVLAGQDGSAVRGVLSPAAAPAAPTAEPTRVRTMAVGDHLYVVPQEALPYVGRQLDLALFDVHAPAGTLQVEWAADARPVPGLELEPAAGGRSVGRVTDPAAFGAALAASTEALAGVRSVRPAASADPEPTANPQYPLATLTVKGLDALGVPAFAGSVSVTNAEDVQRFSSLQSLVQGEVSFSVPVGHYSFEVSITTYEADGTYVGDALMFFPEFEVTAPQTVVTADARTAKTAVPVPATPNPSGLEQLQATYSRLSAAGSDSTTAYMMIGGSPELSVTPTAPVSLGDVRWYTYFRLNAPAGTAEPYLYDLVFPSDNVPAKFTEQVPAGSLATLDTTYAAEGGESTINTYRTSFQEWEQFPIRFASAVATPMRRTEYVTALPGVGWIGSAVAKPDEYNGAATTPLTEFRPGQRVTDRYLVAPTVPGVDRGTLRAMPCPACRQGDQLLLNIQPWTDAGGHAVRTVASDTAKVNTQSRLYADGTLIAEGTDPAGAVAIPADASKLRLELDTTASAPWKTTGTQVRTAWSWTTSAPTAPLPAGRTCTDPAAACAFQPLLFAEYGTAADATNALPAGEATRLTVMVRPQAFDPAPAADRLTLEVSADEGATWTAVPTTAAGSGQFTASVTPAAGSGFLSLRIHATDPAGGALDQTVLRALRVLG